MGVSFQSYLVFGCLSCRQIESSKASSVLVVGRLPSSRMDEEDEFVISSSDSEASSESYEEESQDSEGEYENSDENPDGEDLAAVSPPSDADRKFKNVNDLLRYVIEVSRYQFELEPD